MPDPEGFRLLAWSLISGANDSSVIVAREFHPRRVVSHRGLLVFP